MALPQILAATVTIAFEGLMLFQGNANGGKHVAVVKAAYHDSPHVEIWRKNGPTGPLQQLSDPVTQKDDIVSFGEQSAITSDDLYDAHVPELGDFILNGHVHDDVLDESVPNDGVMWFVTLPGGTLSTWNTFYTVVELTKVNGGVARRCLARFVILKPTASLNEITVTHLTVAPGQSKVQHYPLMDNDLVVISNDSLDKDNAHFPLYKNLLNLGGTVGAIKNLTTPCPFPPDGVGKLDAEIEKVLVQKDHRHPNGDCGPVDNPPPGG